MPSYVEYFEDKQISLEKPDYILEGKKVNYKYQKLSKQISKSWNKASDRVWWLDF